MATQNKPTHMIAYVVNTIGKGENQREVWRNVGTLFPFKEGEGFHLVVHDQMAITGKVVIRPPKAKEDAQE